ncbi:hypothetical protein EZV62_014398 [Acer yangbiense]|uniref:Uncharacterized protein n=1 Tax=Acer yangbiense TaxID=1000413 RepID=A0A5C7HSJ4_9ROSI|nr:hypothetical protein EZV62_014398 [Acer yangbiense]
MAIDDVTNPALAAMVDVSENQQQFSTTTKSTNPNMTHQQHQNPNMTPQNQQHNPQSPKTLEADLEHPPNSDPDDRIEADPNQDDVEMVGFDPNPKPDPAQEDGEGEGEEKENFEKELVGAVENNLIKLEDNGMEEDNGRLCFDGKNLGVSEQFLRRCNFALGGVNVESIDFEDQKQSQEVFEDGEEEEEKEEEEEEEEEEDDGEEEEEEEEEEDFALPMGFDISNNLFHGIEPMQAPFNSFQSIGDTNNTIRVGSSQLGHDSEILHSNKRMRMTGGSDFDMCMEQLQHSMGKARMMYVEKEQACEESSMNQQLLINELHKKDAENQQLQAMIQCLRQKRQSEVNRYERELFLMTDLLNGYRNTLKETRKAFAEYRELAPCPQLEVPLYKDVIGGGGLVLSVEELEKRRLKEEEEERRNRLLTEKIIKDFEAECVAKFEAHRYVVESWNNRLLNAENQIEPFRELIAKRRKVSKCSECDQSE